MTDEEGPVRRRAGWGGAFERRERGSEARKAHSAAVRKRIIDSYLRGVQQEQEMPHASEATASTALRRTPHPRGYQAIEIQAPEPQFPDTLAVYCLVFGMDPEYVEFIDWKRDPQNSYADPLTSNAPKSYSRMDMLPLLDKLRSSDMIVRDIERLHSEEIRRNNPKDPPGYWYCLISISEKRQKQVGDIMGKHNVLRLRLKKKEDDGRTIRNGGAWMNFKQHLSHLYEKSSEGSLFSSGEQLRMIEFLLNDVDEAAFGPQLIQKEACEPGNTPLRQLIDDGRIFEAFPMHHPKKLEWLRRAWVYKPMNKQPIEDIREYFGSEIAIYFCFQGFVIKSLWVPATVGTLMFITELVIMASHGGEVDNPYMPLYAIFVALWSIMFASGWKVMEMTLQREWGLVKMEVVEDDRRDFVQEEYFPDPLWRALAVGFSFIVVLVFVGANVCTVVAFEMIKSLLHTSLGEGMYFLVKLLGAMGQAGVIQFFRWAAGHLYNRLNDFENWQKPSEYHTASVAKRMGFGFINSYFAIFFVSFIANSVTIFGIDVACPEHKCIEYVEFMIAIIYVQQAVVRMIFATVLPWWERKELKKKQDTTGDANFENERFCKTLSSLDESYSDLTTDLGYFMLFGADFPLLALFCLITKVIELRLNAFQFTDLLQRPMLVFTKDIGRWADVLDIFSVFAILSQTCFLAFTSSSLKFYFPGMTKVENVFYAVVVEHALLVFKVLWDSRGEEVPKDVQLAFERKNYERELLMDAFDQEEYDRSVAFYTSDDGEGMFYSKAEAAFTDTGKK